MHWARGWRGGGVGRRGVFWRWRGERIDLHEAALGIEVDVPAEADEVEDALGVWVSGEGLMKEAVDRIGRERRDAQRRVGECKKGGTWRDAGGSARGGALQ